MDTSRIMMGDTILNHNDTTPAGAFVTVDSREWYRITDYDHMPAFFMSIVNPDDLWIFLSSTGGITAGRRDRNRALFPYTTVDRVTEGHATTGSLTSVLVADDGRTRLWEPLRWASAPVYHCRRTLYKSAYGDAVMFEEHNTDLGLVFRYGWEASPRFGIHRFASIANRGTQSRAIRILDGVRNVLPAGVSEQIQREFSNLLDAYKRSEGDKDSGLATYALSATLTDLAEPSESLRATTVWSYGLWGAGLLLSEDQIPAFTQGKELTTEAEKKGGRGAYLRYFDLELGAGQHREWGICAELEQDHLAAVGLRKRLRSNPDALVHDLADDLARAREELVGILSRADGLQSVGSPESAYHHAANVLFNVMRGGYFVDGYRIERSRFVNFVGRWNSEVRAQHEAWLSSLPDTLAVRDLINRAMETGDPDIQRLALEYLPLTFSRRHGDPSRPWNLFSIRTRDEDGVPLVGYQGNWRDIFQNWEALGLSYPDYFPSMIAKFLNATTPDGYNPYRISDEGIDWEVPEPGNPWANIGYWSDHQIVYLSRLVEHCEHFFPGELAEYLDREIYVYADVPYRIRSYRELVENPYSSIEFDVDADRRARDRAANQGADGKLLRRSDGSLVRGSMAEKLLILVLAKTANFVPGGGIWMNTQRPEWNDANNALAGWGLSLVTLAYLVRFIRVLEELFTRHGGSLAVHAEVADWLSASTRALETAPISASEDPRGRLDLMQALGESGSRYRQAIYSTGFADPSHALEVDEVLRALSNVRKWFEETLRAARLDDGTFDSYRVLKIDDDGAQVNALYPMLEGQIAGLSAERLSPDEALSILSALRAGPLYRKDQHSYMLYPNRDLPGFFEKNAVPDEHASTLNERKGVLARDEDGVWRFDGSFRNVQDLRRMVEKLPQDERRRLEEVYENTFNHAQFTGRSGTFFAYEGLGSIYWHMVSKLLLAVQELLVDLCLEGAEIEKTKAVKDRYVDVRAGLGFNKTPQVYGAVPIDPYSHTPWGQGAKQPGMTGQVKEEVVARYAELGLVVREGKIQFLPDLILEDQWCDSGEIDLTFCGLPIKLVKGTRAGMELRSADGAVRTVDGLVLNQRDSRSVFSRTGEITALRVVVV
jgi:hypothetical protein